MNDRATILVVEDDLNMMTLISALLEKEGPYRIVGVASVAEARAVIERQTFDLVISDRFLGEEDGLDLCRWVKEHPDHQSAMFVILTGATTLEQKMSGFDAGADDYITKPFHPPEFLSRVRVMLRIKAMQDELRDDRQELERLNATLAAHLGAVESLLVNLIGLRVPDAAARADKALQFARWMGERLALEGEEFRALELAARLHEIGKVILTDDILAQERAKRSSEYRITLQQSPIFGQMIVGNIPELRKVGLIIRHQRENFDGTGHPGKLMHAEIPLASRILRVVNHIEEVRDSSSANANVVEQLRSASGTILDPSLVRLAEEYCLTVEDPTWL